MTKDKGKQPSRSQPKRSATKRSGSPVEAPSRKKNKKEPRAKVSRSEDIDVDKLDLDVSYVGTYNPPALPKKPERVTWPDMRGNKDPLIDPSKLPEDWHMGEPDLDDDDLDAQIQRCVDRVKDNIMPNYFKRKMRALTAKQNEKKWLMDQYEGRRWEVVQRIETLVQIKRWMLENGDPEKCISSVTAVMGAYESGNLDWTPGLVTYWSKGTQLCQPRPWDWNEFLAINSNHEGHKGFWVEGNSGLGPNRQDAVQSFVKSHDPRNSQNPQVDMFIRLHLGQGPVSRKADKARETSESSEASEASEDSEPLDYSLPFLFKDDTGSDFMVLYASDLEVLQDAVLHSTGHVDLPPLMGVVDLVFGNGTRNFFYVKCIRANMLDDEGSYMCSEWEPMECVIRPGDINDPKDHCGPRLIGPWLRRHFYTASNPDGTYNLCVSTHKTGLSRQPAMSAIAAGNRRLRGGQFRYGSTVYRVLSPKAQRRGSKA